MSLFGSLQSASNTLQAMQIGLQVVGNNIANANTEGFVREKVNYVPAPIQKVGSLNIGLGVRVDSITQQIDKFLGEQVRGATGERISAEVQNEAYKDLEQLLSELSEGDLSTSLTNFFGSLEDTTNASGGDTLSVRNLTVLEGQQLSSEVRRIESRAKQLRDQYDEQIAQSAGQINQLTEEIAKFNVRVTQAEGGSSGKSDAGALRTARNQAVSKLTELVNATVSEQPSGGLSISVGGEFLVFENQRREVNVKSTEASGEKNATLIFTDTNKALDLNSGRVHGLAAARDEIVDGFRDNLNEFAGTLAFEFNKTYSQGQGLDGFKSLASQERIDDPSAALDAAGLPFTPNNGSFEFVLIDGQGETKSTPITIRIIEDGTGEKTSLNDVVSQIDAIDGVQASVDSLGRLEISTQANNAQFTFAGDNSGFLAAMGLNTFFTGSDAATIGVNRELDGIRNAGKLALSNKGLGGTFDNANRLAALIDQPLEGLDGASIIERYDQVANELAQNSTVAGSVAEGLEVFESTLANEFQAVSGVNIDEEAIDMISLQRIYQATARMISTIQEMLDTLVRL